MLVTWKYRPRNTFIQRLDPRTRLLFFFCVIFGLTLPDIWDYRIILSLFAGSLTLYLLARIEWKDVKRVWIFIFILVFGIVGLNALLSGRGGPASVTNITTPIVFSFIGIDITVGKIWFALTQVIRMLTMTLLAIPIPYTIEPNIYGTAFRKMGASDKVSFTMDLAFRFMPTFARDFTITMDSQRARGYELEKVKGGVASRLRRLAPLIIPVVMQSTVTGEEVIDAMDLRAFGTNPRTWIKADDLRYKLADYFMLGLGLVILVGGFVLRFGLGIGEFFIPDFFMNLFL
jgi:energy-coupling factor transport system permease protein